MFHVWKDEQYCKGVRSLLVDLREEMKNGDLSESDMSKAQTLEMNMLKGTSMDLFNSYWNHVTYQLRRIGSFNKVYLEGICNNDLDKEFIGEHFGKEGLGIAINYLIKQGSEFRQAELSLFNKIRRQRGFGSQVGHRMAETYLADNIKDDLKEDERGLILFGNKHRENIVRKLRFRNINAIII
tara:strand:- start:674 stop:1222 length:549 start_codon:yes stop_codon:yes gene_type:complete